MTERALAGSARPNSTGAACGCSISGQFAGRAILAGLAQPQGQVERARGSGECVRVCDGDQIGRQRKLGQANAKFGTDAGRLARNQG